MAVPVASANSVARVGDEADELIALAIADTPTFAVADYYCQWRDLSDKEVLALLHPKETIPG